MADLSPANPIVHSLVDELLVKCVHQSEGCGYTCQRQMMPLHLRRECEYAEEQIEDGKGEEGEEAQKQDGKGEGESTDTGSEPRTATSAPTPALDMANANRSWFSKLSKNNTHLMHQLLETQDASTGRRAPMKWENFLKLMRAMGFTYDPSPTGSSVQFQPPNRNDRPITFHKPHPDPTLQPIMLQEFAKKLKRYYGWNEEDLLRI